MYHTFCLNQDLQNFQIYGIGFDVFQEIYHPQEVVTIF